MNSRHNSSVGLYESLLRPLLFALDPETVHDLGMTLISRGAVSAPSFVDSRLEQTLFGVRFPNPVGLAAGFDKNAIALEFWDRLGFGFVELGTVTYHAQPGNPKPRMFRFPEDKAVINRLGFNNAGAAAAAIRVSESRPSLPFGINLGKSKITELKDAPLDYQKSYRLLHRFGDYFVVNVSSPNTPGLRQLQDRTALAEIFAALREVDATRPLFVKVAPDLEFDALDDVIAVAAEANLTGIVATNTTLSRSGLSKPTSEAGGLSGAPLRKRANDVMRHLSQNSPKTMTLIGVGGIFSADHVWERIASGAHLCQMYTGWVYGGPATVPTLLRQFSERMDREGVSDLAQIRNSA